VRRVVATAAVVAAYTIERGNAMPMGTDDSRDALREWRWRAYRDHLEDLGYDLEGGAAADPESGTTAGGAMHLRSAMSREAAPITTGVRQPAPTDTDGSSSAS